MRYFLQSLSLYDDAYIEQCLEGFPPHLSDKIRHISSATRRRERVAARHLLAEGLRQMGLYREFPDVEYDNNGKPFLANYNGIHFNLSHCREYVAVAIDSCSPVGIDVESRRRVSPSLVKRVCSEAEQKMIATAADPDMEFLRLWTRKEAWLKYTGTGIVEPLANVPPLDEASPRDEASTDGQSVGEALEPHDNAAIGRRGSRTAQQCGNARIDTHPLPDGDGWVSVCWDEPHAGRPAGRQAGGLKPCQ